MNKNQEQLPAPILAIIEVFGRENIERITLIQSSEEPEPASGEIKIKQIRQLDLFGSEEVQNG